MISKLWKNGWVRGFAAAGLFAAVTSPSYGSLTIDLRAADGSKTVTVTPNQVVPLQVFAIVNGSTGGNGTADEAFQSFQGSFLSTPVLGGSAIGNFGTLSATGFLSTFGTVQPGTQKELNNLPGLDLGEINNSNLTQNPTYNFNNYAAIRTGNNPINAQTAGPFQVPVTVSGDTTTFQIGTINWTVTTTPNSGSTTLNFVPRFDISQGTTTASQQEANAALWYENGVQKDPTLGTYAAGSPITVFTPEPASLGLLGFAGLGLLARRRRGC